MNCENCFIIHLGDYGSGRFCSSKCARSFSTKNKRQEINLTVSEKLKGKPNNQKGKKQTPEQIKKRMDGITPESRKRAGEKFRTLRRSQYESKSFEELTSKNHIKMRVREEQNYACNRCGITHWLDNKIVLEVEHKDGNKHNNSRDNLEALCPNCHSLTPTWRRSGKVKIEICNQLLNINSAPVVE